MWSVLLRDESGQGLTEYVLIIALVAVALVGALILFKDALAAVFGRVKDAVDNAPGPAA